MPNAEELLVAVVEAEESGVAHWAECPVCRTRRSLCEEGERLLKVSTLATIQAKLYVDVVKGRVPAA